MQSIDQSLIGVPWVIGVHAWNLSGTTLPAVYQCNIKYYLKTGLSLSNFPSPFVKNSVLNVTFIVGDTEQHGPYGWGAGTIDVLGAIGVAGKLGSKAKDLRLLQKLDTQVSSFNSSTGIVIQWGSIPSTNIITVGGPGVNMVTNHYEGFNGCPFYLTWVGGAPFIHSDLTQNNYGFQPGVFDHALIALHREQGRNILVVWGLTGQGSMAACQLLQYYEDVYVGALSGRAMVVKWQDSNGNQQVDLWDQLTVVETWGN